MIIEVRMCNLCLVNKFLVLAIDLDHTDLYHICDILSWTIDMIIGYRMWKLCF